MSSWEDAYKTRPPWDVGRPQPAFVELAKAGELTGRSVLDAGCGTGENAIYLARKGFSVTGVDLTSRAIAAARAKAAEKKLKVDFQIGNVLSLDFKDGSFDNVVDSGLESWIPEEDTSCSVLARRSLQIGADREELPGTRSNRRSPRSSKSTTFGTIVRHTISQKRWEGIPNIGNKNLHLTSDDTSKNNATQIALARNTIQVDNHSHIKSGISNGFCFEIR